MPPHGRAERKFDECWEEVHREIIARTLTATNRLAPGDHRIAIAVRQVLPGMLKTFEARKALQREVFDVLARDIGPAPVDLMDLCAGDAPATLALLITGKIRTLNIVDNGHSNTFLGMPQKVAQKFKAASQIRSFNTRITPNTPTTDLPDTQRTTLIESGLSLPLAARTPTTSTVREVYQQGPLASRSSHILNATLTLDDVLAALGGVPRRQLDIFDTPFHRAPLTPADHRNFIEAAVAGRPEWRIATWEATAPGSPTYHAKLVHE